MSSNTLSYPEPATVLLRQYPYPANQPIAGQLLEDELYDILKEQYNDIGLFLRRNMEKSIGGPCISTKSINGAKYLANQYSGRPSVQARKHQKLLQEAENIREDIQALSRFAAVQRTAFHKILKKYHKWTNSDALRVKLETEVFFDAQLVLNLTGRIQNLSVQTAAVKILQDALCRVESLNQHRASSLVKPESPISRITKTARSGPLEFDAALVLEIDTHPKTRMGARLCAGQAHGGRGPYASQNGAKYRPNGGQTGARCKADKAEGFT